MVIMSDHLTKNEFTKRSNEVDTKFDELRNEIHATIGDVKKELREEIQTSAGNVKDELREEIQTSVSNVKEDLRQEIQTSASNVKDKLREEIENSANNVKDDLREEIQTSVGSLRSELKQDIRGVGAQVEEVAHQVQAIAEMLGGSLEKDTVRDEKIDYHYEKISEHDMQINALQKPV